MKGLPVAASVLVAVGIALARPAMALERGTAVGGARYVSGGISETEQTTMRGERDRYVLWLVTAASRSGAYLSDVRVTISNALHEVVFDAPLDGPWLLIDLPPGRYDIVARFAGQIRRQPTMIRAGERRQAYVYFDVNADTLAHAATPD